MRPELLMGGGTGSGPSHDPGVRRILLEEGQTPEDYLALMSTENPGREAWGGEGELYLLALRYKCRVCTLISRALPQGGRQARLLWGPLATDGEIIALLYNGTHYDALILDPGQLEMLGLRG